MLNLSERLETFIRISGLRKEVVAQHLHISTNYLNQLITGRKFPSARLLRDIESYTRNEKNYLHNHAFEAFLKVQREICKHCGSMKPYLPEEKYEKRP